MPIQGLQKLPAERDQTNNQEPPKRRRSWWWWKITTALVLVVIGFIGLVGYRLLSAVNTTSNGNKRLSVFAQLGHLVRNRDAQLRGEAPDRVNVLLLGIGGEGHEGPLLTDTIILASLKPSTGQVALLSIPRDLAVAIPKYGIRKINNANALGKELKYPGGGEQLASELVANVTGQPIHYFGQIDFAGFMNIVDDLGGIEVNVEQPFTDREYPTPNFGYQTIRFDAGRQPMDGATALKFVRSRHGSNGEGSDFARSRRQQLVLEAIGDKIFSFGTFLNPVKVGNVLGSLGSHTGTNMEVWELLRLARLSRKGTPSIITRVLDSGPTGALKNVTGADGAFLLQPKDETFADIRIIARDIFIEPQYVMENAKITIANTTSRLSSSKTLAATLESLGYPKASVFELSKFEAAEPIRLVDYSGGRKPYTVAGLEDFFGVKSLTTASPLLDPAFLANTSIGVNSSVSDLPDQPPDTDILIVVGPDYLDKQLAKKQTSFRAR
ncbi:MAG: LCP family protein [Candidatus Kerfeldbacteria bacterium]|nr:LCP family protein [Candidatus Kerfeldbacteria bacterium]